jgi:hypothetical protein
MIWINSFPFGEVALFDSAKQIRLERLAVLGDDRLGLSVGEEFMALLGLEMEFDPEPLVLRIDERIGMRAVTVHETRALRQTAVAHQNRGLVQALR